MRPVALAIALAALFAGVAVAAKTSAPAGSKPPACLQAEVNPVTGHTLCINPLGAPVEAPPPSAKQPCAPTAHGAEAWSHRPNCAPAPPGGPGA
jgi:hypothetical protein